MVKSSYAKYSRRTPLIARAEHGIRKRRPRLDVARYATLDELMSYTPQPEDADEFEIATSALVSRMERRANKMTHDHFMDPRVFAQRVCEADDPDGSLTVVMDTLRGTAEPMELYVLFRTRNIMGIVGAGEALLLTHLGGALKNAGFMAGEAEVCVLGLGMMLAIWDLDKTYFDKECGDDDGDGSSGGDSDEDEEREEDEAPATPSAPCSCCFAPCDGDSDEDGEGGKVGGEGGKVDKTPLPPNMPPNMPCSCCFAPCDGDSDEGEETTDE